MPKKKQATKNKLSARMLSQLIPQDTEFNKVINVVAMGSKIFVGAESLIFCFVYNFRNH